MDQKKHNILNNKIQTDPAAYWNNSNNTRPDHKHRHALGAATRSGVAESGSRAMLSERKRVTEKSNCMEISHPFTSSAKLQSALLVKNLDKKCKVLVTCFVRWWRNQSGVVGWKQHLTLCQVREDWMERSRLLSLNRPRSTGFESLKRLH